MVETFASILEANRRDGERLSDLAGRLGTTPKQLYRLVNGLHFPRDGTIAILAPRFNLSRRRLREAFEATRRAREALTA